MNINNINNNYHTSKTQAQNFGRRYVDYTNAPSGTYLPKNQIIYISKDSVLLLGANDISNGYILGLGNSRIEEEYQANGFANPIVVGRNGNIQVPNYNADVSRQHLEILQTDGNGYYIKDISTNGTRVLDCKDYTNKTDWTRLPKGQKVIVNKDALLSLADGYYFDLSSPNIQQKIKKFKNGETFTIGREGDVPIFEKSFNVSRQHIEITKLKDYYIIKDISKNGTSVCNIHTKANNSQEYYYNYSKSSAYQQNGQSSYYQSQSYQRRQEQNQHNQYQYQQRNNQEQQRADYNQRADSGYQTPPNQKSSEDKTNCSAECQKDLDRIFKPLQNSNIIKLTNDVKVELRREYKQLMKKYHPDINHDADSRDFVAIQAQYEKYGLIDSKGKWIE